jgi:hypothetical protein
MTPMRYRPGSRELNVAAPTVSSGREAGRRAASSELARPSVPFVIKLER